MLRVNVFIVFTLLLPLVRELMISSNRTVAIEKRRIILNTKMADEIKIIV